VTAPVRIETDRAPAAIGAYSQGIRAGDFVYTSGQLGMGTDGAFVEGGVAEQTRQSLANVAAVLEAGGSSLARVVKVTVFLRDMNDFAVMNGVYADVFTAAHAGGDGVFPARAAVQAAELPKSGLVEIEAIGLVD
jgi:2-iminobutanoate/2-iminopropanoate deaminase